MRLRLLIAALLLVVAAVPATAAARATKRPDLVVSEGSVAASGTKLTGSFAVKDRGSASAKKSKAALIVTASKKDKVIKRFSVKKLKRSKSATIDVSATVPSGLPAGRLPLKVCADAGGAVTEKSETNNCRRVGTLTVTATGGPNPPASTVPTDPVSFQPDQVFTLDDAESNYWVYVPSSYDASHQTPFTLFVWLHGCGGESSGDIYTVSPGQGQDWISVTVGGREDGCWDPGGDQAKVLAAIASMKTHFNINPRRVIIGGYSSGGDLAYRTAFYNANMFSGLLAENTSPFRDTGSSADQSIAAAAWKFNVVHLAHTEDETYGIDGVRSEIQQLKDAGFPVTLIEKPGSHSDNNTDSDLQKFLLPHIDDGWLAP
jgi:predicted esterase